MKKLKSIILILIFIGVSSAANASVRVTTSCGKQYNVIAESMDDLLDTVEFLESLCE